ncbi:CDP-glycerol glycerophosphotransferase family protein [Neobacillus jeddahensis]|uniref:CDP-glycerol glycerophosphotransferase family protein n=1 Tax=Neobacillus jeddahensis TaxID=1461580 RepID=UPI0005AA61BD|nr:CDP-glycerol glycerophosphotransferase family protein [Neobacillus jeddahensis]
MGGSRHLTKRVNTLKSIFPSIILKLILGNLYRIIVFLCPINENKVVFASYRSNQLDGNLEYIYKELKNTTNKYSFVFIFEKYSSTVFGRLKYYKQMITSIYHLATSRYFFIDDYFLPVYMINPRSGTEIIQLWHAAGAFKKFGHSTIGKPYGPSLEYLKHIRIHSNYSKAFVSTDEVIPFFEEAFDMPAKNIYPLGLPRTDYFFETENHNKIKEKFLNDFPELENKKLILYAPTFRGKSHQHRSSFNYCINFNVMKKVLGDNYAILVHLHPYMTMNIDENQQHAGFVFQIDGKYAIEEILILSDILITDYSSIIFDYSILNRPIGFYVEDLEEYTKERDFYYQFENFVPGPLFASSNKLAQWIKNGEFNLDTVSMFKERFLPRCDGKVSSRVVNQIFK